jgi:hypothetical protein
MVIRQMAKGEKAKEIKITKEICDKVLYMDCRVKDNVTKLQKAVMKLPFIKCLEDTETDYLEEKIKAIEKKFSIHLAYIQRSVIDCEDHYSCMIKHDTGTWLKTIYAQTIWEGYAKALFFMFFYIEDERRKMKNRKIAK